MKLPSLSVVLPNYNHGKFLPRCVGALANQSIPPNEIIAIDDASTDNSWEIFHQLQKQYPLIKLYRNETNQGVARTINRGMDLATGDFVALPAADDEVMPGLFEKSLRLLAEHPQAGISATICRIFDVEAGLKYDFGVHVAEKPCYLTPEEIVRLCRAGKFLVFGSTMLWRRDAILRAGKYHLGLKWHSDWFAHTAVMFRHGMCFVPEMLGEFRIYPSSVSSRGRKDPKAKREIFQYALELLEQPENQDIAPYIRASASLAPFGKEMLWMILSHRRYWKNANPFYLRQALWWTIRTEAKKVLPNSVAGLYYKLAGVSAPSETTKTA